MTRIVAILGTAVSSRLDVNKEPPEVERWGQSGTWRYVNAFDNRGREQDRWFEHHSRAWLLRRAGQGFFSYLYFMQHFKGQVYMGEPDKTIPNAVQYEREKLKEYFFGADPEFFTSSIALMTALAIYEGVDEIRYFGVDMAHKMEYIEQRNGVEYFIGWARGSGKTKVHLPASSPILKAKPYAQRRDTKVIQETILERQGKLGNVERKFVEGLVATRGRLQELLLRGNGSRPMRTKRYKTLKDSERGLEEQLTSIRAKINENDYWLAEEKGLHLTEDVSGPLVYVQGKEKV